MKIYVKNFKATFRNAPPSSEGKPYGHHVWSHDIPG